MQQRKNTKKRDSLKNNEFFSPLKYVTLNHLPTFTSSEDSMLNFEQKTPFHYPEHIAKSDNTRCSLQVASKTAPAVLVGTGLEPADGPFSRPLQGPLADTPPAALERILNIPQFLPRCSNTFITGQCPGHRHLKATVCGKEWCESCGRPDSLAHRRRMSRWWGKLETFDSVGYMVVTIPENLRHHFKDQEIITDDGEVINTKGKTMLQEFRRYVKRKLQRTRINGRSELIETPYQYTNKKTGKVRRGIRKKYVGYDRGFIRYHYAGDCDTCQGKGCEMCYYTGAGREFKPHLNILIPEKRINKEILSKFRLEIALWFKRKFNLSKAPDGNIHYRYYRKPAQRTHKLKYVTRSTFRIYEKTVAETIYRFHTACSWGKFKVKEPTFTEAAEKGCCKKCLQDTGALEKIEWNVKLTRDEARRVLGTYRHVENGYFVGFKDIDIIMNN